ncbi:MAG: hypothetical protein IPJ56_10040 [Gemmatimonadetes bacterium]|nr:hypothetical protein [Gemmatimonadota bacterium]
MRTIARRCRTCVSESFLATLAHTPSRHGLSAAPSLDAKGLRGDHWIYFAKGQFPPEAMLFPRECDLVHFISACIGTGPFRDLRRTRIAGYGPAEKFRLPDGRRIDLLC